jgi:vitamin B12 transporter
MKVFFLVCCIVVLIAPSVLAQTTGAISGTVTVDQAPGSGFVVLQRNKLEIARQKLDEKGNFAFGRLPDGNYTVVPIYNRGGVQEGGESKDVVITGGARQIVNFTVEPRPGSGNPSASFPIREYVTVAAGESQTIEQVSKTVDVIDGQQMRDRADFALVESLRTIPGFRVAQFGGFGRLATIKTRGLRNQDTALLIDGVRFRDPTAITGDASPFLADVTLTSVSRVEVLRGSGSSLYGTNAIGGVIDLRTPEPTAGTHGQISANGGGLGFGRFRGNISHGTNGGKVGIAAGVSRSIYTKGIDGDDRAENTNLQTRIDIKPSSRTNVSGQVFFTDANVRLNTDPDTFGTLPPITMIIDALPGINFTPDANDPDRGQQTRSFSGTVRASQAFNERFFVSSYYHGLTTKRTNDNGLLGAGFQSASTSNFDGRIDTVNAQVSWTSVPYNTLTGGYEFERENFANDGRTPSGTEDFFTRAGQRSNTFFLQDLLRLFENRFQIAGGFRVQHFNLQRPEFSLANAPYSNLILSDPPTAVTFDGAVSYFFRKSGTKLRAHAGNGYRVPSLYERFGTFFSTFPSNRFVAIGDPFLKPEKTLAMDAGLEQDLANDHVHLSATYFWTHLRDIIGFGNIVPNIGATTRPFGGYENQKGGTARGIETSVKVRATSSADIFASYTFTNSDQLTPQVSGSGIYNTLGVPAHQFTLVATQRYKRFWVNFDFLATSSYLAPIFSNTFFATRIYRFDGNRRGDLTAGYTFALKKERSLRVYGTIENVFDQEYYENGFRTSGAVGRVGVSFSF